MTTSDTQEAGKGMHTPTPWKFDDRLGCRSIKGAKCYSHKQAQYLEVACTVGLADDAADRANAQLIVTAVNSHSTLTEENARLLQENKAMREALELAEAVIAEVEAESGLSRGRPSDNFDKGAAAARSFFGDIIRRYRARTTLTQGEGK